MDKIWWELGSSCPLLDSGIRCWTPRDYANLVAKRAGSASQAGRLAINVPLIRDGRTWSPAGGKQGNVAIPPARDCSV